MEFLIFYMSTIIMSLIIEIINELKIFKDTYDAGYKINIEKLSQALDQVRLNSTKIPLVFLLIPVINIIQSIQMLNQYSKSLCLSQLKVMGVLEEINEQEKKEYAKSPTGLNAVILYIKTEVKKTSEANVLRIDDGDLKGSLIYYKKDEKNDEIIITKVIGPASDLVLQRQKENVLEHLKMETNTPTHSDTNPNNQLSIEKQKLKLQKMKKELLTSQEEKHVKTKIKK